MNGQGKTKSEGLGKNFFKKFLFNKNFLLKKDCFYVTLYRDEDRGDVVVDSPKNRLLPQHHQNISDKLSPSVYNKFTGYNSNNLKLAAFVGPVSNKNVNILIVFIY